MAKKYMSVFNNGTQDLYIKDNEAREAIGTDVSQLVDLGLPSGTLWAKCNIGATEETDYGKYYMYGKGDREYNSSDAIYEGTENPLASDKDTATVVLGAPWHMPTNEQFEELFEGTNNQFISINGVYGCKFTNKTDATKYIFIPASGFIENGETKTEGTQSLCWTSTPYDSTKAYRLVYSNTRHFVSNSLRSNGYPIRPVCDSAPLNKLEDKADKDHNHDDDYSPLDHTHDSRYYTEEEVDNKLSVKSNISHNHDTKYATKEELNNAVVGALVNDGFYFAVDRTTMKLHAYSANSFALNFTMQNGYLVATSASE